jgi:hypothetical protein
VPSTAIGDYTWLLYGERKIGKTTLAAQFEAPFFIMFEPGGRALALKQVFIQSWSEFLQVISLLEKNPAYCQTVVIDTGFMCYERCFEHCMKELNITDPRDEGWGNGWKFIDKAFRDAHQRIEALGLGLVVTAHSELREVTHRTGIKYDKVVTQLSKQAMRWYAGTLDVIAYYHYDEEGNRALTIAGSADVEAGSRCGGRFKYADGTPVSKINMGTTPEEGYANLVNAFNNNLQPPREAAAPAVSRRQRRGR